MHFDLLSENIVEKIPAQKEGEEELYIVKCNGPCKYVEVKIKVEGDADLFVRYVISITAFSRVMLVKRPNYFGTFDVRLHYQKYNYAK